MDVKKKYNTKMCEIESDTARNFSKRKDLKRGFMIATDLVYLTSSTASSSIRWGLQ